jgi:hypothetical protein
MAAMALFIRVMVSPFGPVTPDWQQILTFVSIASMVLGAFAAIGQRNIKRLMAYSSIGHMGFALVGLAAGTEAGVRGVIIYLVIYMAMTLGAFACILAMRRREGMVEEISDLAGLSKTHPVMALMLAMICSRSPASRRWRLLRQVLRLPRRDRIRAVCARGDRRARQRGRRLLLSPHHQDHVFRRAGARFEPWTAR